MKRRNFIIGTACFLSGFVLSELKEKKQIKNNNPDLSNYIKLNDKFDHLHIILAAHCNLNCKSCDVFSPVSSEEFLDLLLFKKDLMKIKELAADQLQKLIFLGGEPLLYPDIIDVIDFSTKLFPEAKKAISTNGILLEKQSRDFWLTAQKSKTTLLVSKYPINIDRAKYEKIAQKYGVKIQYVYMNANKFYDLNSHEIIDNNYNQKGFEWGRPILDLSGSQDYIEKRYTCRRINNITYIRGNLYSCKVHAHIKAINDYFKLKIPITNDDYIKVADVKSLQEIEEFLNAPKPLCKYCKQCHNTCYGGKELEWGFSKREISEWTYVKSKKDNIV